MRWTKIGDHGVLTPDQARDIARRWAAEVATGGDPAETRSAQRAAPTASELLDRYLSEHAARKNKARTAADSGRLVNKVIRPALGRLKVADVTANDVARFHGAYAATPYQANRALDVLSKAFSLERFSISLVHSRRIGSSWRILGGRSCRGGCRWRPRGLGRFARRPGAAAP